MYHFRQSGESGQHCYLDQNNRDRFEKSQNFFEHQSKYCKRGTRLLERKQRKSFVQEFRWLFSLSFVLVDQVWSQKCQEKDHEF